MLHNEWDRLPNERHYSGVIQFTLYLTQLLLKVTVIYVTYFMKTRANLSRLQMSSDGKSDVGPFAALHYTCTSILAVGVGGANPFGYCETKRKEREHAGTEKSDEEWITLCEGRIKLNRSLMR